MAGYNSSYTISYNPYIRVILVDAGILGQQAGAHFLEAFLLVGGDFFGRFFLGGFLVALGLLALLRLALFAATTAADDIDHRNYDRAALSVLKQVVRDVVFEFGLEAIEVDALEALLDGAF